MTLDLRLKAYAPNGASLGLLPAPDSFSAAIPLNDLPGLSLDYGVMGPRSDLLGQPLELAVEVSGDNGATWAEPDDCRFLYLQDGRDPIKTADTWQAGAKGYVWRLSKARVLAEGQLNGEGRREFNAVTVGALLGTLWTEATTRGALAGMTLQGGGATDASGAVWGAAGTISRTYDVGVDYLQVLMDLANSGLLDFRMAGRTLKLYRPDTVMAVDRTVGNSQVQLTPLGITEAPFRRTWEGLADFLQVAGDEGSTVALTNPTALKPWGRWEDYITQGGVEDAGTLTALGQRYQTLTAQPRAEFTQGLALGADMPSPLVEFMPGDYVWSRVLDGARTRYRVRQVTVQKDGSTVQGNVVLNDRFLEEDIRVRRAMDALTGGASGAGSTGGTPTTTPPGQDILAPAAPSTAPALTSSAYLDQMGAVAAQITVDWPDVTTNADGTPIGDLAYYEVQTMEGAPGGGKVWRELTRVEAGTSVLTVSPYVPASQWSFRVRAVDTSNNWSAWTPHNTITVAKDASGPVAPSTPTLKTRSGVLEYAWDGKSSTNTGMDADFFYLEVHASQNAAFVPTLGNPATLQDRLQGPGYGVMAVPAYGAAWHIRYLPVDKSGNAGTPSAVASATVKLLEATDISPGAVRTPHLEAGSVTTEKMTVGARGVSILVNGHQDEPVSATDSNPAGWSIVWGYETSVLTAETAAPITGARSARITLNAVGANVTYGSQASQFPVVAGERYYVRARVKALRAMPATRKVSVTAHTAAPGSPGPFGIFDPNVAWMSTGAEGETTTAWAADETRFLQGVFTVPTGHTMGNVSVRIDGDGVAGDAFLVDGIEAWPAVTDGQVTEVSAGKLRTGVVQAGVRVIAGDPVAARAEMSPAGWEAYATDGVTKTFQVSSADGSVFSMGAFTTNAAAGKGRVVISAVENPYQTNQTWATLQFYPDNPAWGAALLWAAYGVDSGPVNWGQLSIASPKLGTRDPAQIILRSEEQTNQTVLHLAANRFSATANEYVWGDADGGQTIFRVGYTGQDGTQMFSFRSPGGKRINFNYGILGTNEVWSKDEGNTTTRLDFRALDFFFQAENSAGNLYLGAAARLNNRVALGNPASNNAWVWGGGTQGNLRATTTDGAVYIGVAAAAFNVNSDARQKTEAKPVTGVLEKLKAIKVQDYRTPHGQARKSSSRTPVTGYAQRGVMAQDWAAYWPDGVFDDDVDGTGLSLDLYHFSATVMAGLQEETERREALEETVRALQAELATLRG